jgi:NitT/TauT family transport system permease protein
MTVATTTPAGLPDVPPDPAGLPETTARRRRRVPHHVWGSIAVAVAGALIWWFASTRTFVVPSPLATARALIANLGDPTFLVDLQVTARAIGLAFVIGAVLGLLLGLLLGLSTWARVLLEPTIIALNGLPKIVLYPVLLPIFSLSGSKVVMGVLFALFPVLINVATGVRELPRVYWKLGRSVRASHLKMLVHIILPGIRRPLLTGIRLAISLAAVGVVLSEFFATRRGLGRVVLQSYSHADYASMMATIMLLVTASFLLSILLWRWERAVR